MYKGRAIEKGSIRQVLLYKCSAGKNYKLFYTYGQKTLKISMKGSFLQSWKKINFFKYVFLAFWLQLHNS